MNKKRKMWFRRKTSIGAKESLIAIVICIITGVICAITNTTSIKYYNYCFNGVRTEAVIVDKKQDDVAYWDKDTGSQALRTYNNLYLEYDGKKSVFEESRCKVNTESNTVEVAYIPGVENSTITDFGWGKLVGNIMVFILFILTIIVAVHERLGYKYNKKHMRKRVIPVEKEDIQL